jgi:hypothetical protein
VKIMRGGAQGRNIQGRARDDHQGRREQYSHSTATHCLGRTLVVGSIRLRWWECRHRAGILGGSFDMSPIVSVPARVSRLQGTELFKQGAPPSSHRISQPGMLYQPGSVISSVTISAPHSQSKLYFACTVAQSAPAAGSLTLTPA